jgi:predicted RNA-binding Zn ribbon-like protein
VKLDSYRDAGVFAAVGLVNELAEAPDIRKSNDTLPTIARILAVDPASVARLEEADRPGFVDLAHRLRRVFDDLQGADVDSAASRLNDLLEEHPAQPHLAKENGRWRLHHHSADTALVPMWTSICAEGMARMIGIDQGRRFGTCEGGCNRVFLDLSKNASRRFCSTTCQNRVKTAAYRLRESGRVG